MTPPTVSPIAAVVAAALFCCLAAVVLFSLAGILVLPLLRSGALPEGWSFGSALTLVFFSLVVVVLFGISLYRRLGTRLEADGLVVPGWGGGQRIAWSQIQRVSGRGLQIKLHTSTATVVVNPLCYRRPREVVPFLLRVLPVPVAKGAGAA